MKLVEIWNAQDAFAMLAALKKPPTLAYRLMKYERKYAAEVAVCEEQRSKCVCEVAGVEHGSSEAEQVTLQGGTPEYAKFLALFNEFLNGESDLTPVGMDMEALAAALESQTSNTVSENDLKLLEPFFCVSPLSLVPDTKAEELHPN